MNGVLWTGLFALTAHLAFLGVDISQIVDQGDCLELFAGLHALSASDAGCLTNLVSHRTFVLVVAEYNYPATLRTF